MPQKERYEVIITSKLDELPIPDMADAIWARIEAQLDLDLPTDDNGGDVPVPTDPPVGTGLWIGAAFLAFVGALFAYYYFQSPPTKSQPQPIETSSVAPTRDTLQTALSPAKQSPAPPGKPKQEAANAAGTIVSYQDTTTAIPDFVKVVTPPKDSSTSVAAISPPPGKQQEPDSIPKKKRGLQGINDKDYRIVPKKD
ncbi:hypothetical protein SAMN05444008_12544 [Cnuella takakiae]|uniref:Uncharacterized protein n=1 Tax=Cnuella takakiae TaxID=1302690 RepID=A0A1M5IST0_9BACT|nr:hypothetical protein [Cnuella takakiae]OLY93979.1 hypothetical protein BUE76_20405 [Cnuella takakiae]SHG31402.1 hypothetical protein SAMN05444008_12544 [Cnuella takakiae]